MVWQIANTILLYLALSVHACDTVLLATVKSSKVRIAANQEGVRGLLATCTVAAGDTLLAVPVQRAINLGLISVPSAEAALRLVREIKRGDRSAYKAYLDCLPTDIRNSDTFSDDELAALRTLPWEKLVEHQRDLTKRIWQGTNPGTPQPTQLLPQLTMQQYQNLVAVITTRALGFAWGSGESLRHVKFLVPVLDMANHDEYSPHVLSLSEDGSCFQLVAGKALGKDEEVTISYGSLALDELALYYGFIPQKVPFGQLCAADRDGWTYAALPASVQQKSAEELGRYGTAREIGRLIIRLERYPASTCDHEAKGDRNLLQVMVCRCHQLILERKQQLEGHLGVKDEL